MIRQRCRNVIMRSILPFNGSDFIYVEKNYGKTQDTITTYSLDNYPKELTKKVALLKRFKEYLNGEEKKEIKVIGDKKKIVYVKKWIRSHHAIFFRLSNKIIHVTFEDCSEIIINTETREVHYLNKKGEHLHFDLDTVNDSSNLEMTKRLKYTRQILTQGCEKKTRHNI